MKMSEVTKIFEEESDFEKWKKGIDEREPLTYVKALQKYGFYPVEGNWCDVISYLKGEFPDETVKNFRANLDNNAGETQIHVCVEVYPDGSWAEYSQPVSRGEPTQTVRGKTVKSLVKRIENIFLEWTRPPENIHDPMSSLTPFQKKSFQNADKFLTTHGFKLAVNDVDLYYVKENLLCILGKGYGQPQGIWWVLIPYYGGDYKTELKSALNADRKWKKQNYKAGTTVLSLERLLVN